MEWQLSTIGEISTIFGRIGYRGYTKADIVKEGEGAISLSPSNIQKGSINYKGSTYITWEKYIESPEIQLEEGDSVLVKTGSTYGKTAYVDKLHCPATLNPQIVVFKQIKIDKKLFSYLIYHDVFQSQIDATIVGGAIPTLSQRQVERFIIPLPPTLTEQRAIARALSDTDALLAALDALIAKKEAIKRATLEELLSGERRLAIEHFSKATLERENWIECKLIDIAEIEMGQSPSSRYYNTTQIGLPLIQGNADIRNRKSFIRNFSSVCPKICKKGDILISVRAPVGEVAISTHDSCLGRGVAALSAKVNKAFLYYLMIYMERFWDKYSKGSTFDSINSTELKNLSLFIPFSELEQQAIADILSSMDSELTTLCARREKLAQVKAGMMEELLTGRTRLV